MPSATFFNLPEEKRQRLIEAAWDEVTAVSFDKVSINRIIQNANISRGSFYQYFTDKSDLLHFLLEQVCQNMEQALKSRREPRDKDLFAAALKGYDWVMARRNDKALRLPQLIRLAQLNPEMDLAPGMALVQRNSGIVGDAAAAADFWQTKEIQLEDHLELLYHVVGGAVLRSFRCQDSAEEIREQLRKRLIILKHGMLAEAAKGELE